ncbi:transketolase family protein [Thiomicrospira sp. S5]|uniref:transketolase family protein n=1 Tax=Thiomicrospira sp. S5 TaxID=1803865 RepID=UPI000F8A0E51|nr:transketolase C-terminal domain-containing protein [Thiomicrospira sp. S5]AZR81690.1 hypothetical protein AYJ59_04965 [Thiomicrospira sp. S5]
MRNALMDALYNLASEDKNFMLLTADLGYGVFEEFESRFPFQYLNVGVAEQNMIGIASGLALEGKTVFLYSIGNFPTLRCLEQIRNDACYHDLNINIIAMGGGFSYGSLGMSHHATEDIAIMRSLPGVTVIAPCTASQTKHATLALAKRSGVGYLRIDKSKAEVSDESDIFEIGEMKTLVDGADYAVFVIGGIAEEAVKASIELKVDHDIGLKVISLPTLKPFYDHDNAIDEVKTKKGIITLEEGNKENGLSFMLSSLFVSKSVLPKKFKPLAINDTYVATVGTQAFLREYSSLSKGNIISIILEWELNEGKH